MEFQLFGGITALSSAAFWALGIVLWKRVGEDISPYSMNLGKGILGTVFLIIAYLLISREPLNTNFFILLGISGLLGITLGDTFFFMSLINLGPRLTSLMGMLIPVFTAISAFILLGERLSLGAWGGVTLTISGVTWVLWERLPPGKIVKNKFIGICYGLLSILCTTGGIILSKIGMVSVSALQGTLIRILWGTVGLVLWGCLNGQLKKWLIPFRSPHLLREVSFIVLIGTFGGFFLFLLALKYIDASVATVLNSTTPIFVLPITAIILKEKISLRAIAGVFLAVIGVIFIFVY